MRHADDDGYATILPREHETELTVRLTYQGLWLSNAARKVIGPWVEVAINRANQTIRLTPSAAPATTASPVFRVTKDGSVNSMVLFRLIQRDDWPITSYDPTERDGALFVHRAKARTRFA